MGGRGGPVGDYDSLVLVRAVRASDEIRKVWEGAVRVCEGDERALNKVGRASQGAGRTS